MSSERELVDNVRVYKDADGYAASFTGGGTWDHATPSEALAVVGEALNSYEEDAEGENDAG